MVLQVFFWVILFFCFIAALAPDTLSPYLGKGRWIMALVLLFILGWHVFGGIK